MVSSNLRTLGEKSAIISKGKLPANLLLDELKSSKLPHSSAQINRRSGIEKVLNVVITPTDSRFIISKDDEIFRIDKELLDPFYEILRKNGFQEREFLQADCYIPVTCLYSGEVYRDAGTLMPVGIIIPQFVPNSYLPTPSSKKRGKS